jgi:hypothetical protein
LDEAPWLQKKKKKKEKHIEKIKHFLTQGKSNSDLYASELFYCATAIYEKVKNTFCHQC